MASLTDQKCTPCSGDTEPMSSEVASDRMRHLSDHWSASADSRQIVGTFKFKNYYRTQAFVNAVAYIAHREDHHPDITFGYNKCSVTLTTHAVDGLSDNDFISAAKIDQLID